MARAPIFAAIRHARGGRGFTDAQVVDVDALLDRLRIPRDDPAALTTIPAALAIIKQYEGCELVAYKCPAGVWTIGWGATGAGIGPGVVWTQAEADARLERDVAEVERQVRSLIGAAPTTPAQFGSLVSFAYNCGTDVDSDHTPEGLGDSSLLRKHLAGDFEGAATEFGKWIHGGGRKLRGLVKRRAAEAALYRGEAA